MAIGKVIFDVNTGLGIPGLTMLAWELKAKYGDGRFVMFMNRKRTKVKILFDERTLLAYSKPSGQLTVEELKELPSMLMGEWISPSIEKKITDWLDKPVTQYSTMVKAG